MGVKYFGEVMKFELYYNKFKDDNQYKAETALLELTECLLEIDQSRKAYFIVKIIEFLFNKLIYRVVK